MIDVRTEELLPFNAAREEVPWRPHISTWHRWRLRGVRGVKLETVLIGGRRYTSREALQRFIAATTVASSGDRPVARTSRQRNAAIEAAERELTAAGI